MNLPAITGSAGEIVLLKLDEPALLANQLGFELDQPEQRGQLLTALECAVQEYGKHVTGVILSPEFNYQEATDIPDRTGRIFCLERTLNELDPLSIPVLQTKWGIEYVRNNLALAKLLVYASGGEAERVTKLEFVNEIADGCRYEGVAFLLEVKLINGSRYGADRFFKEQVSALELLKDQADLLLLESPRTAFNCLTLTGKLRRPWVLTDSTGGADYSQFKEQLRDAVAGGAQGVSISRHVLPTFERGQFDHSIFRSFVAKEGRDRVLEIARIAAEMVAQFKPPHP